MKKAILHIGTHKAASTAVQMFLARNRQPLRKLGVCYPTPTDTPKFAHHSIAWAYGRMYNPEERRPSNYRLEDALRDFESSGCNTIFLSSEDFLRPTFHDGYLESLFGSLRTRFSEIVVTAYVRNRKDFFTSSYNQWIKALAFSDDFDTYLKRVLTGGQPPMHYTRALQLWGQLADKAVYLPLLPAQQSLPVEKHLLHSLGYKTRDLSGFAQTSDGPVNPSIGPMAILGFRQAAGAFATCDWFDFAKLEKRGKLINRMLEDSDDLGWNKERFKAMDQSRLKAVEEVFRDEDNAFAREYFDAGWVDIFPGEGTPDIVTERQVESLATADSAAIEYFTARALDHGQHCYLVHEPS